MPVSDSFPYVEGTHSTEGDEHIKLKGIAVYWLLNRGFNLDDIDEEHPVKPEGGGGGSTRYIDIHAEQKGSEVFIECERYLNTTNDVALGGRQRAREGEAVFVFTQEEIQRLSYNEVYIEQGDYHKHVLELNHFSDLPMLDLSAYE